MNASLALTMPQDEKGEAVVGRIIASGTLLLHAAAHFGGGAGDTTDAMLLRDGGEQPFIPGASLAGALRSYLRRRTVGALDRPLDQRERHADLLSTLFGGREEPLTRPIHDGARDDERTAGGHHSMLAVDDAFQLRDAARQARVVLRDRVRIDPERRVADDQGKFDYETLEPGTAFSVRLELTLRAAHRDHHTELKRLLNTLLDALTAREVRLGAHTRRGLGQCAVERWSVLELDFRETRDVVRWLRGDEPDDDCPQRCGGMRQWEAFEALPPDGSLSIVAALELAGPLLQRSDEGGPWRDRAARAGSGDDVLHLPDVVQLTSDGRPVVSGTALAGALRHRAIRIGRTLRMSEVAADQFVAAIWGPLLHEKSSGERHENGRDENARASRLIVDEAFVEGGEYQRQTRIAIDRFTGGARESALMEEAPVWPRHDRPATLTLRLRLLPDHRLPQRKKAVADAPDIERLRLPPNQGSSQRFAAECGLLLLLLKDLCTGDLPLGGEASVGRGIVRGQSGSIELHAAERRLWRWTADRDGVLRFERGDPHALEEMVQALVDSAAEESDA